MVRLEILPWPNGFRCPFVLRDDDVSFFTRPETLERLWSHAWQKGFVVSFSVLPKIACHIKSGRHISKISKETLMVPPEIRGEKMKRSITGNPEIAGYLSRLREEGKINLILHGYTHERIENRPEFAISDKTEIERRVTQGQQIFQRAFGRKARVFVPPWDEISRETWEVLSRKSMGICRRFPQFWDEYLQAFSKGYIPLPYRTYLSTLFPWYGKNYANFYGDSYDLRFNGYFTSFLLNPHRYLEMAKRLFTRQYENGNLSFWGNHHWEFFYDWSTEITQKEHKKCLDSFLDFVDRYNVWKCGVEDLLVWLQRISQVRIERGKEETILSSEEKIEGLTLRTPSTCRIIGTEDYSEIAEGTYILKLKPREEIHIK